MNSLVSETNTLRAELEAAKLKNAEMVTELKMNANQQLTLERERWNREKEDGSRSWENQRRDLIDSYERQVNSWCRLSVDVMSTHLDAHRSAI